MVAAELDDTVDGQFLSFGHYWSWMTLWLAQLWFWALLIGGSDVGTGLALTLGTIYRKLDNAFGPVLTLGTTDLDLY